MMILVLGVCPDVDLEVRRSFRFELAKVRKLEVWKVKKFDRELTLILSGWNCCSRSWNRFDMSFGTCVQNLRSFRIDLIWFSTNFES